MSDYGLHLTILVCIYLILAQSFNLTFGLGKMLNLAHIAAYAIGAYATALLSTSLDQSFWICVSASTALSAILGLFVGAISLKLEEDYFAIGTLAFSALISTVLNNWKSMTRGVLGISGIPRPELLGLDLHNDENFFLLLAVVTIIVLTSLYLLFRSAFSRKLRAQAAHPQAAMSLGIVVENTKNASLIVASILAGLAGSFFSYYINYIAPSSFGLQEMVFVLSIVIIGKPGSFCGTVVSTVFLVLLPEVLRWVNVSAEIVGPMRQLTYSAILFVVVYVRREKLSPAERWV